MFKKIILLSAIFTLFTSAVSFQTGTPVAFAVEKCHDGGDCCDDGKEPVSQWGICVQLNKPNVVTLNKSQKAKTKTPRSKYWGKNAHLNSAKKTSTPIRKQKKAPRKVPTNTNTKQRKNFTSPFPEIQVAER